MKLILTILIFYLLVILLPSRLTAQDDSLARGRRFTGSRVYAAHSVLATGDWYKLAVPGSGIYRLGYSELQSMGINLSGLDPRNIRIYGNGGGMLPENNSVFRYDDLQENAIQVTGEEDGRFDASDYILFYASGPVTWTYNTSHQVWEHRQNIYSDSAYYFLTIASGPGKRLTSESSLSDLSAEPVTTYDFHSFHEKDKYNLILSGRSWFGEQFDQSSSYDFSFDIPGLDAGSGVSFKAYLAARSTQASSFTFTSGSSTWTSTLAPISTYFNSPYASGASSYYTVAGVSSPVPLRLQYNKSTSTAIGWLDFIDVSARPALRFYGGQLPFRDMASSGSGKSASFTVAGAAGNAVIWDVTDPVTVKKVEALSVGSDLNFTLTSDTLHEFVAFDLTKLYSPVFTGKVKNQDLHSILSADLIIVAPPVFYDQAVRLASYHSSVDDLNTLVVEPESVYNEFSSGAQDVIAIRDFVKMLYDRGGASGTPRYLLLFGDGSYDNKNRLPSNTNFIPTWQTAESFDPVRSGVSDDYFGLLDDNEGSSYADKVDLGIGRLPVKTVAEAEAMVNKIIHYAENSASVMGDWRNVVAFVADDEDNNEHVQQADNMAGYLAANFSNYNVDKIYLDAYTQISTTAGDRYPEVNKAITQRVEKGALLFNYTGHGGETGWAHEEVLQVPDINGWSNYDNMPVFITATCEFSRFDDPARTSAGELVFLNEHGGGIALFTTTRPTYGSPNFELNQSIYKYALTPSAGGRPRLGDILCSAKRESGSDENGRKFILLGDPAQRLAYPALNVETSSINGRSMVTIPDTLKAYAQITINGRITDNSGKLVSDFNGLVYPTVFDKAVELKTRGNDGGTPFPFNLQKSILYRGKVEVLAGVFSFTFIVPKDIAYRFGFGKLSYYATDGTRDASGSFTNLIIGGAMSNEVVDNTGPDVSLYINDEMFTDGGITDENPWLLAKVRDDHGINTIGSGIGHDITAVLDSKTTDPYILNDFYESDVNTFRSGIIRFPFSQLSAGEHSVTVKVWDIFNNSTEATLHFKVLTSGKFVMQNARNYPNPFISSTRIVYDHNQQGNEVKLKAEIFSLTGQLVSVLEQTSFEQGTTSTPLIWNGCNSLGNPVSPGMYFYTLTASTSAGLQGRITGKLILSK